MMPFSVQQIDDLKARAGRVRRNIISMLAEAGSGHTAGSLGAADILVALYFNVLKHDAQNPGWPERDRFVLSNGHICPALYAVMAEAGYLSPDELSTLRKLGSRLQGHPHREKLPGLETTSGPLGCGLSQAAGMALAGKMDQKNWRVVCLMSDGEQEEGNTWEAVMFAGKNKLDNLTALIDHNNIQIDGFVEEVMPLEPLKLKYEAFNWNVLETDGHDFKQIISAFETVAQVREKPTVIIAKTIPGKGVSFMENDPRWHGRVPSKEEDERAMEELAGKI